MKILWSVLASFACFFCSCADNKDTVVGKWSIVDVEFGAEANPLLVSGVIATEQPTNIEFSKTDIKVLNDEKNILEQHSYTLVGDLLVIRDESGQTDSAKVVFISPKEINLQFDDSKLLRLKR